MSNWIGLSSQKASPGFCRRVFQTPNRPFLRHPEQSRLYRKHRVWGQIPCPRTCPHLPVPEDRPLMEWLKASQRDAFSGECRLTFAAALPCAVAILESEPRAPTLSFICWRSGLQRLSYFDWVALTSSRKHQNVEYAEDVICLLRSTATMLGGRRLPRR